MKNKPCGCPGDLPVGVHSDKHHQPQNLFEYFEKMWGATPQDQSLKEVPLDSEVGLMSKKIIDTARQTFDAVSEVDHEVARKIYHAAYEAVEICWRG